MLRFKPSLIIAISFLLVILSGALLLSLPISSATGSQTNFLDAYFTANSATCVTGLTTLDTGVHFSVFGLLVIMVLMQVGGLGYMTFSTFMVLVFKQKLFISQKIAVQEALNVYSAQDVISVLKKIFSIVFVIELVGFLVLFIHWLPLYGIKKAIFYSAFHTVSAFNNAGFALPKNFTNLMPYVLDPIVNITITSLIIIGGIGFIVIAEIIDKKKFTLHTKTVLLTTLLLIVGGTLMFLALEYRNPGTLGPLSIKGKLMVSYFQSVTPRTAGFNTIDYAKILPSTALMTMFLMFVGASPGGTGGGVKTTTFALIFSTILSTLRGGKNTIMFGRRVPPETVRRSFAIIFLSVALIGFSTFILKNTESFSVLKISFEVFSAFGTVGLSLGITPYLSPIGKIIIIAVMFIGRIGPLTLLLALTMEQKEPRIKPPKEGLSIG